MQTCICEKFQGVLLDYIHEQIFQSKLITRQALPSLDLELFPVVHGNPHKVYYNLGMAPYSQPGLQVPGKDNLVLRDIV
jgi:hypothetical protein